MKTLVVYYSYTENTKKIAERIASDLKADIEKLIPQKAYSSNYDSVVKQAQDEVNKDYATPIKPLAHSVSDYDRIILGAPTWWYKMSSPVLAFLKTAELKGKILVPFMTNAGWPGMVIKDMERLAKQSGAIISNAKEIKFHTLGNGKTIGMDTSEKELNDWINSLK